MKIRFYIARFLLTLTAICFLIHVEAQPIQRYNTFKYTVNDGLLQSTMVDINFDNNNFCWLSFPNGIQKFDGKKFIDIPIQEGLPDNKWVNFFRCKNGDLLINHAMGVSKYDIRNNKFTIIYRNTASVLKSMIFLGEDEGIVYCFDEQSVIMGFDCGSYKKVKQFNSGVPASAKNSEYSPTISQNIIHHVIGIKAGSQVYMINLKESKFQFDPVSIPSIYSFTLWLRDQHQIMFYEYSGNTVTLRKYDFLSGQAETISSEKFDKVQSLRSRIYNWEGKTIFSRLNHLYETNAGFDSIITELVNFENKPIANNSSVVKIIQDNYGNLYVQTVYDGFRKILKKPYPIKYYGTEKKEDNYTISILADKKNNRILSGTFGSGVLVFDTSQQLIKQIKNLPGETKGFSVNCILKKPDGDYILSVFGDKMWLLSKDLSSLKPLPVIPSIGKQYANIGYFANLIFSNREMAIVKAQGSYFKINFENNKIQECRSEIYSEHGAILFNGNTVSLVNEKLIIADTITFKQIKRIPFTGTGGVRCFLSKGNNELYLGSNKGIYKVDSNYRVLMHMDKNSGLPDECIYSLGTDKTGNIWCSTNKGLCRIDSNKNIFQLTHEDGLQENEFNTNSFYHSEDGENFFGGVNGVSSFFSESINESEEKLNLFFTDIKINNEEKFKDTAVWNINEINVPYDQNAFSFDFIAMATNNPNQYIYQYKMDGVDQQWSQNSNLQTIHYFLSPGTYVFKIYASRVYNKDITAMREIRIIIHPPFWRSWWFITAMCLLFAIALAYSINRYNRDKYQKKVSELESEHKIQLERERISRDLHDNIGAYASTVLYKTELLQKESLHGERNELMNDLRFASKDIITSLRETIWALKKEEYDAQECLLRIRNFIQPFIKYYPNIRFSVNGEAPISMILHYTKALNLVRIVQEAVSNAIKHADAAEINIESSVGNDRWKLTVSDNGAGFDYEGINELQQGNGLNNMKQRAIDSGFDFSIDSINDKGTSITIIV